uniref:G-protein coupled receptors family 1 profile domain-containing protein n=1 Tax=Plectus sambesii TaxID=2011161 RepID=A0A914VA72_9BILA
MIVHNYENCTVGSTLGTVAGHIGGIRMNQMITLFLGLDRLYALFWPYKYRLKNQATIARYATAFSAFMGATYMFFLIGHDLSRVMNTCNLMTALKETPALRVYRLFLTTVTTLATQVVYIIVFYKLRRIISAQDNEVAKARYHSANATITLLLVSSLLFMTLPSIVNLYDYLSSSGIFLVYGPLISIVNITNGAVNVFIYSWAHKDFNKAIKSLFKCHNATVGPSSAAFFVKHTL